MMNPSSTPNKAFCSWSGGKDSCLALDYAQRMGYEVTGLFNMLTRDGAYSRSHGLSRPMLEAQAQSMGKAILFGRADWDHYETVFLHHLTRLKGQGIAVGVFGDMDLMAHREWVERVCKQAGLQAVLPLWGMDREVLLDAFLGSGYRAMIVSVRESALSRDWLGRTLDLHAVEAFRKAGIDLCGEQGEYHTFVFDGPLFDHPVPFKTGAVRGHQGYAFMELMV